MRIVFGSILAFVCIACHCDGPNCPQPDIRVRVVNSDNQDLLFDLNIPLDSIIVKAKAGNEICCYLWSYNTAEDRGINVGLNPAITEYTITYKKHSADFTVQWKKDSIECCEEGFFSAENLFLSGVQAPTDEVNESRTYIITL